MKLILKYSGYIIFLIAFAVVVNKLSTCRDSQTILPIHVSSDSLAIAQALEEAYRDTVRGLLDRIFKLKVRAHPTGSYGYGSEPLPFKTVEIVRYDSVTKRDTLTKFLAATVDVPISVRVTKDEIKIVTRNTYNAAIGQPFAKVYAWPRLRQDFTFVLIETTDYDALNGISMYFQTRAFDWDGFGIGGKLDWPGNPAVFFDVRFVFWETFELSPRLSASLSGGKFSVEGRWRL